MFRRVEIENMLSREGFKLIDKKKLRLTEESAAEIFQVPRLYRLYNVVIVREMLAIFRKM